METPQIQLPDPRPDGFCCECCEKHAVTRDGRFCKGCLSSFIRQKVSPGSIMHNGISRSYEKREYPSHDPSPWEENAIRVMEGD